jgi:hypothetical protein
VYAVGERGGVDHRIAAPVLQRLLLQEPPVDDAKENTAVDALVRRQSSRVEAIQGGAVSLERGDLSAYRRR